MKKSFFFFALLFLFFSCSAKNPLCEPFSESDYEGADAETIVLRAKKINVSDVGSLVKEIAAANQTARIEKSKDGEKTRLKIPHVLFKPSISLYHSDWQKITEALRKAESLRVSLDFSSCKMADDGSKDSFSEIPYGSLSCNNSLYEIRFPEGLSSYGDSVCYGCVNLRSVYFPKDTLVASLGSSSFNKNPNLDDVHIYKMQGYMRGAFNDCGRLSLLEVPGNPVCVNPYANGQSCLSFSGSEVEKVVAGKKTYGRDSWLEYCSLLTPKAGAVKEIAASSVLDEEKFSAANVLDASWKSWVEGSPGDGRGERISLVFEEPTTISYVWIKNGFGYLPDAWKNNRPKDIRLVFDDDESSAFHAELSDELYGFQKIDVEKYDKPYSKMTLVIDSVYQGSDGANDCAIDEIRVNSSVWEQGGYRYDSKTNRMFMELYSMDVGRENVRENADGQIMERYYDGEADQWLWASGSQELFGVFHRGNDPGTGAGGSRYEYAIRLNSSGEHYLFVWLDAHDTIFYIYPQKLEVYLWKNDDWVVQTSQSHAKGLDPIFSFLSFLESKGYSSEFCDKRFSYVEDGISVTAYPIPSMPLPVTLDFSYDIYSGTFAQEKTGLRAELAFGSRKTLQALGDIKALFENEDSYGFFKPSIFSYPAAYNPDPDVVDYLRELGFSAKEDHGDERPHDSFTVLEAWQAGSNSNAVRDALLKAGASYSGEMLKAAFESGNIEKVKELAPLVLDRAPMLASVIYYYYEHRERGDCLSYIKSCLKCLKDNGADLNEKFDWEKDQGLCLMEFALNDAAYDLVLLYRSLGVEIPKKLNRFEMLGMGDAMGCVAYNFKDYCREDNQKHPRALGAIKLLDYLLQNGHDIDEADGKGWTMLHGCCKSVSYSDVEFAKLLLKRGADANKKNNAGQTPLALLVQDGSFNEWSVKLLAILVDNGADTSALKEIDDDARSLVKSCGYVIKYDSQNDKYLLQKSPAN